MIPVPAAMAAPAPKPLRTAASVKEGESAPMPQTLQHRFRIFLHLLKLRETLSPDFSKRDWTSALVAEALDAEARREQDDWLGYEMVLFRAAALTFCALEEHHRGTAHVQAHAHPDPSRPGTLLRWPDLDADQKQSFHRLQEGLIRAFLQQEGADEDGHPAAATG